MSGGFTQIDRSVLAWVTVLSVSAPVSQERTLALRELSSIADEIDRMHVGEMHAVNAAVLELSRCWAPGEPAPARCIDYCRLALLDFHMARQRKLGMS